MDEEDKQARDEGLFRLSDPFAGFIYLPEMRREWFIHGLGIAVGTAAVYAGSTLALVGGHRVFIFLRDMIGIRGAQCIVAAGVLGVGFAAHSVKQRNQFLYGAVELVVAAATAIRISLHLTTGQALVSQWVGLVGCTYVVARGLNNMSDARAKSATSLKAVSVEQEVVEDPLVHKEPRS